jgi:hypothetical protein
MWLFVSRWKIIVASKFHFSKATDVEHHISGHKMFLDWILKLGFIQADPGELSAHH